MPNIFVHRHPGPRSNRLDDTGQFHYRDFEMASLRSFKVNCFCRVGKVDIDFPIVFDTNHMLISHDEEDIGESDIRYR